MAYVRRAFVGFLFPGRSLIIGPTALASFFETGPEGPELEG